MVYKLKTEAETRAHVQLLVNFKGMRTENIFNKVNIPCSLLYPIDKTQTITDRVRIDTYLTGTWYLTLKENDSSN